MVSQSNNGNVCPRFSRIPTKNEGSLNTVSYMYIFEVSICYILYMCKATTVCSCHATD